MLFVLSETSTCTCKSTEILIVAGEIGKQNNYASVPSKKVGKREIGKWKEKCDLKGEFPKNKCK